MFEVIDYEGLLAREKALREEFHAKQPFHYLRLENLVFEERARQIHEEFPPIDPENWVDSNGLHQKNKWTNPIVKGSVAERFFQEANAPEFLAFIGRITGIPKLLGDESFFGAGYHQTRDQGFLNVHVDFNKLMGTDLDRRLNLLLFLNPDWKAAYGGALELWDMEQRVCLEKILPGFNRCVIFETNDISYHGHPEPVNTGNTTTRKSLSVYYYSEGRDDGASTREHNTLYVNTQGARGTAKIAGNAVRESMRRVLKKLKN